MVPAPESFQPASHASAEDESSFSKWLRSIFSTKVDVDSIHSSTAVASTASQSGACLQEAPFAHGGTDAVTIDWVDLGLLKFSYLLGSEVDDFWG
jgi:hypothetical protein